MNFDTVLCNPPYNGGDNETPIYHLFLKKFSNSENSIWIIPSSWTGNPSWLPGRVSRETFLKSGAFLIYKNQNNVFESASVRTTSTVCTQLHNGDWNWVERESGKTIVKTADDLERNKILFSFDQEEISFLERMKGYSSGRLSWFKDNPTTWKIGVFHINRNKDKNQLGDIRVMDPNSFSSKHAHKYLKLWEGPPEEVDEILPKIESFWNSDLIQYLLAKIWHTYTIQRSTFEWIPSPDYSQVWTNDSICDHYNVTDEEKRWIKKWIGA